MQTRLYRHVQFLTEIRPHRNFRHTDPLDRVAAYIHNHFSACGLPAEYQTWDISGHTYRNVIARYNPHLPRRLVVGAHYDVCGEQDGADDNASAVAGLLETARLFAEMQPGLTYGIDFVAYSLEEPPFFGTQQMGSYIHARSLAEQQADVAGMVCYEMIGYFSDEPGSQKFPSETLAARYPDTGNFIIVAGTEAFAGFAQKLYENMQCEASIDVQLIVFPDTRGMAGMSDQRNYWEFGYPAAMINDTSFLRNPNYHQPSDTLDTLNFEKMAATVETAYRALLLFEC